jgi:hypothetical protein
MYIQGANGNTKVLVWQRKRRDNLEGAGVYRRIVLKWILDN